MMLRDSYVMLARYNRWMNEKLYDVAASVSDEERGDALDPESQESCPP